MENSFKALIAAIDQVNTYLVGARYGLLQAELASLKLKLLHEVNMKYRCIALDDQFVEHTVIVNADDDCEALDRAEKVLASRGVKYRALMGISEKSSLFGTEKTASQLINEGEFGE